MSQRSLTHLVLIPSYNSGASLGRTIEAARRQWNPVWVVIDGSTDGSGEAALHRAAADPGLRVLVQKPNQGKGAAVLYGLREAACQGFSHVLTMDGDSQHPADLIPCFMAVSQANLGALVLGAPVFDCSAPRERVHGRKLANWWANLETFGAGIGDALFGFRVYPVAPLLRIMERTRWMRGFDFDPEAAVRLSWQGRPVINLPAPVRYFTPQEGGVSHFHYLRHNILLVWMYARLFAGFLCRLPHRLVGRGRARADGVLAGPRYHSQVERESTTW